MSFPTLFQSMHLLFTTSYPFNIPTFVIVLSDGQVVFEIYSFQSIHHLFISRVRYY